MAKHTLARLWHILPTNVRLAVLRLTNARFTVSVAAVIFNREGKVLLLKHPFRPGTGWGLPGGYIKAGEQPSDALQRELLEEIDLELTDVELLWSRSFKRPRQVEILFRANTSSEPKPQSIEIEQSLWCSLNDLPEGLPENQRLIVEHAVEKRQV